MAFALKNSPAGGVASASAYLNELLPQTPPLGGGAPIRPFDFAVPTAPPPKPASLSEPLPIYTLAFDDIGAPDCLKRAKLTGWRYFVIGGEPAVSDVEPDAEGRMQFSRLATGGFALRQAQATEIAEQAFSHLPDAYEPRILEAPALHQVAVWLHGDKDDRFVCAVDGYAPNAKPAPDDAFVARITALAAKLRKERGG